MNEELRQELNKEIDQAPEEIRNFLYSDYFKDTIKLIIKVNKLNEIQAEAFELELIMYILGINDYNTLEEAFREEVGINGERANEATVKQLIKDCENYILNRINLKKNEEKLDKDQTKVKKISLKEDSDYQNKDLYKNTEKEESTNLRVFIQNKSEKKQKDIEQDLQNTSQKTKEIDYYREIVDEEDTKLKF